MAPNSPAPSSAPFAPAPCCRKRCPNPAAVDAALRVPAIGGDKANALTLPLGIGLCVECAKTAKAGEFTGDRLRRQITRFCKSLGPARPDFRNAWLEFKERS